jgi:hypothetical protein
LLYRLLLVVLGLLVRRAGERELELIVLRHQLAILRRGGKRPQYTTSDRALLAAASRLLSPERRSCFLVSAQTLCRWHRTLLLGDRTAARRVGRPPLPAEIRSLIERLARENPMWGYMRIQGELKGLGISLSATTVANVLHRAGLGSAPRRIGPSWSQFFRAQAESVIGGGADSGLADILGDGAAAASRLLDDRPVATVEADDKRAPSTQPRTPARPRPRPSHPALALPRAPPHLRPCRHSHARDGPETPAGPLTADRAATALGDPQRAGCVQFRHLHPARSPRSFGPRGLGPKQQTLQPPPEFLYPTGSYTPTCGEHGGRQCCATAASSASPMPSAS